MSRIRSINSIFTVDCVIFGFDGEQMKVLLIERGEEPFTGFKAIPGDFGNIDEEMEDSAARVLKELTGLENIFLEQVCAMGGRDRHPWGRIITISYYALIKLDEYQLNPASFALNAEWFPVDEIPDLAFDHEEIIGKCVGRLRAKVKNRPLGFELLPKKFTLRELQSLYESILGYEMDKRNFRRKVLKLDMIVPLNEKQEDVPHKAARYYRFDQKKYDQLVKRGYTVEWI